MYRQSPSRNQRSKGIKVKYVLQICLLLAVCFWLIYQVKHSHDKKKEFDENEAKASLQRETNDEIIKLGRKDIIRPRDDKTTSKNDEKHDEPIEEEETIEEDENKQEDEPEEKNVEEKDNNVEDEQENSDVEVDREEDLVDENETQEVDSEDGNGLTERESVSDENEHEAREEHYKADDASSAVTHDTNQTGASENENERTENSNEHVDNVLEENKENNIEENNMGEERKDLEVESGEIGEVDRKPNIMTSETKVDVFDGSENGSPRNNTIIEASDRDLASNSSSEVKRENHDSSDTNNSILNVGANGFDSNSTDSAENIDSELNSEDLSNSSSNNTESFSSEKITASVASVVAGNNTETSSRKNDEIETGKSDYENSESTMTEHLEEEIQHDGMDEFDTSNSMEEKLVRTDLDTLPEIQTEGTNSEDDVAAE